MWELNEGKPNFDERRMEKITNPQQQKRASRAIFDLRTKQQATQKEMSLKNYD
jgi:hypothetical protein